MAVTLSMYGTYTTGTQVLPNQGFATIDTSGGAQVTTLPANAPAGFWGWIVRAGANNVTLAAPAGDSLTGADLIGTDGGKVQVIKRTATVWQAYEDATYS